MIEVHDSCSRFLVRENRTEPLKYEIREADAESVLVAFPDGSEPDLRIAFEGTCYKIPFGNKK